MNTWREKFFYEDNQYISYKKRWVGAKTLLFLHGMGASAKSRHDLVPYFSDAEYTLYVIDLKGYGFSSKPKDNKYSIAHQAAIIYAFIQEKKIHDAVLIGHSLGWGVAMYTHLLSKKDEYACVDKMILLSSLVFKNNMPLLYWLLANKYTMWFIYTFSTSYFKAKYTLLWSSYHIKKVTREMIERYAYFLKWPVMKYVLMKTAQQLFDKEYSDTIRAYRAITTPTLLIRWENDPILSVSHARQIHELIPHADLHTLPECGHICHEEETQKTFEIIDSWLRWQ